MTFTRLQDVFDKIRQAHEEAAKCCREAMQSTDARVRLLADYFRDREVVLTRTLRMLESSKDENLLDTWVQYASLKEMDDALAKLRQIPVQDGSAITNQCSCCRTRSSACLNNWPAMIWYRPFAKCCSRWPSKSGPPCASLAWPKRCRMMLEPLTSSWPRRFGRHESAGPDRRRTR